MHKLRVTLGIIVGIGVLLLASAAPAAAYGNGAAYQVGLSLNCQNPVTCVASPTNPFGIGGIWGWIVIDKAGNLEGQLEFQGHQNADPALNGAGHISLSGFAVPTTQQLPFIPADPNGQVSPDLPVRAGRLPTVLRDRGHRWPLLPETWARHQHRAAGLAASLSRVGDLRWSVESRSGAFLATRRPCCHSAPRRFVSPRLPSFTDYFFLLGV